MIKPALVRRAAGSKPAMLYVLDGKHQQQPFRAHNALPWARPSRDRSPTDAITWLPLDQDRACTKQAVPFQHPQSPTATDRTTHNRLRNGHHVLSRGLRVRSGRWSDGSKGREVTHREAFAGRTSTMPFPVETMTPHTIEPLIPVRAV